MKAIKYHFSFLLLWMCGLGLMAQNTTQQFTVNYNEADSTSTFQSGVSFVRNGANDQYSLSKDGSFQDQYDLSKIKSINRYYEPPVVHVCTDEVDTDMIVDEVKNDGTVVISSSSESIPKEGEIIVSGPTDAAPYGFLYRVEKVENANGQVVLKTSEASLNEILPHAHIEQPLVFKEATSGAKRYIKMNAPNNAKEFDIFKWKGKMTISDNPGGKFDFLGMEMKEYIKGDVNVDLSLGGTFIWDSDGLIPDRCGVTLDGSLSVSVTIEAGIKTEYKKEFFNVDLEPIVFSIGIVPVVIVPEIVWKYGIRTAEGKIYAKWKPIDIEAYGFDAHLIWNKDANIYGENWDYGASKKSDFSGWSWKKFFQDMLNLEAGLSGEVKFSVWPEINFKLYNSDNVALSTGIEPYAKVSGELALKWKKVSSNDLLYSDDLEIKDNLSLSIGLDIPLEGKIEFNLFGKKIGGKLTHSLSLFDYPLVEGATFVPVFNDFQIYPDDNVKERDYVHVSANRGGTVGGLFDDYEDDYGFCMSQVKKDSQGNELPKVWTYYSMKSKYASMYGLYPQFKIECDIPTSGLLPNATYEVRPYTTLKVGSFPYTFWRKGGTFKTGGAPGEGGGVIIDVPGEDL